tara:strand:+ start:231 stop:797 length:567 start_codon:yes stop_codon:yes gene_type:complete
MEAYPLQWPNRPRTPRPQRSRFDVQSGYARDCLVDEIRRLGGKNVVISTNIKLRQDGLPYASAKEPDDSGVAVYFQYKGQSMCFACDKWDLVRDNMQAIRKTIEALRGIERWGTGEMVQQAFNGFALLEAPRSVLWHEVLGVSKLADQFEVKTAYRQKLKETHPDTGGSAEDFEKVQIAWRQYQEQAA